MESEEWVFCIWTASINIKILSKLITFIDKYHMSAHQRSFEDLTLLSPNRTIELGLT